MMKKCMPPLVLRLIQLKTGRSEDIYLITNVLDSRTLSGPLGAQIYRQRWGIEVQFRHLKQTCQRSKLRSRTPDNATVELNWSLISLWMLQLLALKEQTDHREPNTQTSLAQALRIVRRLMNRDTVVEKRVDRLKAQLRRAVTDTYRRYAPKKSRNYPRRKEEPATKNPLINLATNAQRIRIKQLRSTWANAA
jgi:hypothetical protein